MTKRLPLVLLFFIVCFCTPAFAQFPYLESFRNATAPGVNFGGAPSAFLTAGGSAYDPITQTHNGAPIDPVGNGYLRLTNVLRNQKGYIYSNSVFPSTQGLSVQFEYYIYGGNGADGISFFLYDATADPFTIGGFGGSLGYAQITTTTPASPGVSKGYFAIGLDEFGNFSNPNEGRQGGIPGERPGSVTLRGKGDGAALTPDNYPYLTSVRTADLGFGMVGDPVRRQSDSTSTGYRRVFMDMVPNPNGGYNITVRISRGGARLTTTTVIDNYYYPERAPANLKYGIASSTGDQTNYHEIRNVFIDVLDAGSLANPVAVNDVLSICQGQVASLDVTSNDTTSNEGGSINRASIDLDPTQTGLQSSYTIANQGAFSLDSQGNITFVPVSGFIGTATARYNVKDTYGKTSNNATITITYTGATQANAGQDRFVNISTPLTTQVLQGNSPAATETGQWTQVSGPNTATFTNPAQPNATAGNLTGGVYVFRWTIRSASGCEISDDVQITVNHIPVAQNDVLSTELNNSALVLVLNNDTDEDGNNTIDRASIRIVSSPQNGSLSIDPLTGIVTYTPNQGFTGIDNFVYTVKDVYGVESNQAFVNITVTAPPIPTKLGLAKALTARSRNIDGSYNLTYTFTLVNFGGLESIYNMSLTDDLQSVFKNNTIVVKRLTATGSLLTNPDFNATSVKELLLPGSVLPAQSKEQVVLEVTVSLDQNEGIFNNTALATGLSTGTDVRVSDQSTDGLIPDPDVPGDVSPAVPTPVNLEVAPLFVPGGFSPNNDGINDYFVIENGANYQIHLEIFNRWGNLIYKNTNYKNEWNGKTTEGIHVGDDVPSGTYYYVVKITGKSRYVGHLTLTR